MSHPQPARRRTKKRALCAALGLVAACDGFGAAIVGAYPEGHLGDALCTDLALPCEPMPAFQKLVARAAPSFSLNVCGAVGRACDDKLLSPALSQCELAWQLDGGKNDRVAQLSCVRVTLDVAAGVTTARVDNLSVLQSELVLFASIPVTIDFAHATVRSARITLRGPITLRFSENSNLSDTQISDQSPTGASLELSASKASGLAALDLRGTAHVERSTLSETQLFAHQVELENSLVQNVDVSTDRLFAAELQGAQLALEVGTGVISAVQVDHIKLQRCDTMLITNSQIYMSVLGACTQRLRVDRSSIGNGVALGPIESHLTMWDTVTFGPGAPVALESWKDTLAHTRLCPSLSRLSLSEPTTLACNACDLLGASAEQLVCAVPGMSELAMSPDFIVQHNPFCPILGSLPTCNPVPANENPF